MAFVASIDFAIYLLTIICYLGIDQSKSLKFLSVDLSNVMSSSAVRYLLFFIEFTYNAPITTQKIPKRIPHKLGLKIMNVIVNIIPIIIHNMA